MKNLKHRWLSSVSLALACLAVPACGDGDYPELFPDDFARLGFVEGRWHGAAPGEPVFYESYELANDTLIRILYHTDSTMTAAADTGLVYFTSSRIYHRLGSEVWQVTGVDDDGIHFVPIGSDEQPFTWQARNDTSWHSILHLADGRSLTFEMMRATP